MKLKLKIKNNNLFKLLLSSFCFFTLTGFTSTEKSSFSNEIMENKEIVEKIKEKSDENKKEVKTENAEKNNSFIEAQQTKIKELIEILNKNDPSLKVYSYSKNLMINDLEKRLNENLKNPTINIDEEIKKINYSYLIENFEDIKYKLNLYSKVFKSNQNWFLTPKSSWGNLNSFHNDNYRIEDDKKQNKDIEPSKLEKENEFDYQSLKTEEDLPSSYLFLSNKKENKINVVELFVYNCKSCSKLNDVLRQHKRTKEFNHFLYPAAVKIEKDKFVIADAMIYMALKDTLKKENKDDLLEEINSQLIYDVAYKNLNIDEPKTLLKWIGNKKIDIEEFKKNYYNKEKAKIAKTLPDLYDNLELKTLPLVLIDKKFLMLKNAISDINNRELDSDVPMAIFDYLYLLAELEKNHILIIDESSNALPLKNKKN